MYKLKRKCPICENRTASVLNTNKFLMPCHYNLPEQQVIVNCFKCGFVFVDFDSKDKSYELYRARQQQIVAPYQLPNEFEVNDAVEIAALVAEYLPSRHCRILQVDCNSASILKTLKLMGFNDVWAMSESKLVIDKLASDGIKGFVNDLQFNNLFRCKFANYFDMVIFNDNFQTVSNLSEALKNMLYFAKANSFLYFDFPHANYFSESSWHPFNEFKVDVINYFDTKNIIDLVRRQMRALDLRSGIRLKQISDDIYQTRGFNYLALHNKRNEAEKPKITFKKTHRQISAYCAMSKEQLKDSLKTPAFQRLAGLVQTNKPIVVWGAGNTTFRLLANTILGKANIEAFIDNDKLKQNNTLAGKPIYSPKYLQSCEAAHVLICSANASEEIKAELLNIEFKKEMSVIVLK